MNFWINVTLLSLGFLGTMMAFGGETWLRSDAPLHRRITLRGWVSLTCLLSALALGIWKEVRANSASEQLQKDLKEARKALLTLEPNILDNMYQLTARVPREFDFAFVDLAGAETYTPRSTEKRSPLKLYGGDEFEYTFFCEGRAAAPSQGSTVYLNVGNRDYPLTRDHETLRIAGPIGEEMPTRIKNPHRVSNCDLKIIIRSTDRTRVEKQFEPLLEAIKKAREAEEK